MLKLLLFLAALIFAQHEMMNHRSTKNNYGTNVVCGTTASSSTLSASIVADGGKDYRYVTASGCPGYDWTKQKTPNSANVQNYKFYFPADPVLSNNIIFVGVKKTDGSSNSSPLMGPIGISTNGVALFGNSALGNQDAYVTEVQTFDSCNGHASPTGGQYHYHSEAPCLYKDTAGKHSPLVGFMIDGIPLYGVYGDNGVIPTNLDACNGHTDATYSYYHYHIAPNMTYPYLINCLKGCITTKTASSIGGSVPASLANSCSPASTQYNYTALRSTWTNSPNPVSSASVAKVAVWMIIALVVVMML